MAFNVNKSAYRMASFTTFQANKHTLDMQKFPLRRVKSCRRLLWHPVSEVQSAEYGQYSMLYVSKSGLLLFVSAIFIEQIALRVNLT